MTAPDADAAALCRACGMCCDGSLFGRVDLARDERAPARRRGLRVLPGGRAFEQPCAAHRAGVGCACYDARPRACARFTCRLLDRVQRGDVPAADAVASVRRVRGLVAELERAGLDPADFERADVDPPLRALHDELMRRLADDLSRAPAPPSPGPSGSPGLPRRGEACDSSRRPATGRGTMKTNQKEARVPNVRADGQGSPTNKLEVRSGLRAGLRGSWSLGNKVWTDDWLAPV